MVYSYILAIKLVMLVKVLLLWNLNLHCTAVLKIVEVKPIKIELDVCSQVAAEVRTVRIKNVVSHFMLSTNK